MVTERGESAELSPAGEPLPPTLGDRLSKLRESEALLSDRLRADDGKLTAALAKERRETLREIEALEKLVPKGSVVDDLANRRKSRRGSIAESLADPSGDGGLERTGGD